MLWKCGCMCKGGGASWFSNHTSPAHVTLMLLILLLLLKCVRLSVHSLRCTELKRLSFFCTPTEAEPHKLCPSLWSASKVLLFWPLRVAWSHFVSFPLGWHPCSHWGSCWVRAGHCGSSRARSALLVGTWAMFSDCLGGCYLAPSQRPSAALPGWRRGVQWESGAWGLRAAWSLASAVCLHPPLLLHNRGSGKWQRCRWLGPGLRPLS